MSDLNTTDVNWDVLDRRVVSDLVADNAPADALSALMQIQPSPVEQAQTLIDLAIKGDIKQLKQASQSLKTWTAENGLRRLSNAFIELERVLDLPQRGQAILQAQALTRFIAQHLGHDIDSLKLAISAEN